MTQLQQLGLDSTKVTDVGLQELYGLKELRVLNLWRTKVTAVGIAELKQKLPDLRINRRP
ncbi:MAG TPA: hypothetical protein VMG59_06020 [Phycisphaerae bacterium]|nr:hypothetical protein [Phycisphaerae bacterium]